MGPFYQLLLTVQKWLQLKGIEEIKAAKYTGAFFHAISFDSAEGALQALVDE